MTIYPEVKVRMVGEDGNAFSIIGRVCKAVIRSGLPIEVFWRWKRVATSGDYDHLLATTMKWFSVDERKDER